MKILIFGEFSSFSKNLSAGFRGLGHDCFVFSTGDGFKKIQQDGKGFLVKQPNERKLPYPLRGILYRCECFLAYLRLMRFVSQMSKKKEWDVALLVNANFIKTKWWQNGFTKNMLLGLLKDPSNIFLSSCGGDAPFYDYWGKQNWKNKKMVDLMKSKYLSASGIRHFYYCSTFINKVIPVTYAYAQAWRNSNFAKSFKVLHTIPLPVDTSKFNPFNEINGKIVVFHGIIRPETKGTPYIVEAMNRLQENYPDKVECIAKGGMPLEEYLEVMNRANILIDQTYASSSGMNALYALAKGKVLLGGNEPENSVEYDYPNIPIINIGPDSTQIFRELERLVLNPEKIIYLSKEGRTYVEKIHDSKVIAQKYIDAFGSVSAI